MTEVNKYTNSVTLIMGKGQTGVTTQFAKMLVLTASQTLVHVVMGGEESKKQLLSILKDDFPKEVIAEGRVLPSFVEGTTHLFIGVQYSQAEVFTERDIAYYLSYTRQFIDIGYQHVVMELTLQGDASFDIDNFPELAAALVMNVGANGLYCTAISRVALVNPPVPLVETPEEPRVVEGVLVD